MNSYTKLKDGSWGARVIGVPQPGASITVEKRSGERKMETIDRVVWTGQHDGATVSLCSLRGAPSNASAPAPQRRQNGGSSFYGTSRRACPECGSKGCSKAFDRFAVCDED